MATLKCKIFEYGIHYNSEPSGVEYIFIKNKDWKLICDSKFDSNKIETDEQGLYPKLYRTDTIEDDFPNMIMKIWKCPECGSVYLFDKNGDVIKTFKKADQRADGEIICEGIAFDDYTWDKMTELSIPNEKIKEIPTLFVRVFEKMIEVYKKSDYSDYVCSYVIIYNEELK